MPWVGNVCPGQIPRIEGINAFHTFESQDCIFKCKRQCVPASVLVHIANKAENEKHIGDYVSATSLLGCQRALYLERTKDWYQEPAISWYSVRGTLLHTILENPDFVGLVNGMGEYILRLIDKGKINEDVQKLWMDLEGDLLALNKLLPDQYSVPDWQSEVEFELPLGIIDGKERSVRGTIDVLRELSCEILDYKTVGDRNLPYIAKFGPKPEHTMQFNIYRLLAERGYPVKNKENYVPFKVKRIRAFYLSMMAIVGTGSNMIEKTTWLTTEPKSYSTEISREVVNERDDVVLKRGKRKGTDNPEDYQLSHKKKYHIVYAVPEVELLDLDKVMEFVVEKATILFRAFDQGIIPPLPSPEIQLWKCDSYCPVKKYCDEICAQRGEERVKAEVETTDIPVEE
jgi:hypothetical protein